MGRGGCPAPTSASVSLSPFRPRHTLQGAGGIWYTAFLSIALKMHSVNYPHQAEGAPQVCHPAAPAEATSLQLRHGQIPLSERPTPVAGAVRCSCQPPPPMPARGRPAHGGAGHPGRAQAINGKYRAVSKPLPRHALASLDAASARHDSPTRGQPPRAEPAVNRAKGSIRLEGHFADIQSPCWKVCRSRSA